MDLIMKWEVFFKKIKMYPFSSFYSWFFHNVSSWEKCGFRGLLESQCLVCPFWAIVQRWPCYMADSVEEDLLPLLVNSKVTKSKRFLDLGDGTIMKSQFWILFFCKSNSILHTGPGQTWRLYLNCHRSPWESLHPIILTSSRHELLMLLFFSWLISASTI